MPRRPRLLGLLALTLGLAVVAPAAHAQTPAYDGHVDLTFPVEGAVTFTDSYHAQRGGGTRFHKATDLMGPYGLPVHAAVGGTITWITGVGGTAVHLSAGWAIGIQADDGRTYRYMHLGRQDGPVTEAYAPGMARGVRVERGQLIGFVGHSGNASANAPHLHFEIEDPRVVDPYSTHRMNPYRSLVAARDRGDLPLGGRRFLDVGPGMTHHDAIIGIAERGITEGCVVPRHFCPVETVSRGQTAAFLARALRLPAAGVESFPDVPPGHAHAADIARVRAAGVAQGDSDGNFLPDQRLTRAQMASMIASALRLQPTTTSVPFPDVSATSVHTPWIIALHEAGIAFGDPDGNFLPSRDLERGQMASFLHRAFPATP